MKYVRFLLALLLIPLAAALVWNFFYLVVGLGKSVSLSVVPFWVGLGGYFIFQVVFSRPIRTYVFGHELTHALVGLLSGARVKSFKVSASGGSVVLTKTNVWIALAPYFIPIYTLILIVLYWGAGRFWAMAPYHAYFLFAAGFTLSFHFGLTHFALAQGQSDLKQYGVFFSGVLIVLINCLAITILLKLLFPADVNLKAYLLGSWHNTTETWCSIYRWANHSWTFCRTMK